MVVAPNKPKPHEVWLNDLGLINARSVSSIAMVQGETSPLRSDEGRANQGTSPEAYIKIASVIGKIEFVRIGDLS